MANAATQAIRIALMEMPRMADTRSQWHHHSLRASLKQFLLSGYRPWIEGKGPMNFGEPFVGTSSPKLPLEAL
jgi:hypothetical protein